MAEALYFTPVRGKFDTARVSAFVSTLGFPVQEGSRFLLFSDAGESKRYEAGPRKPTPFVCIITVLPDQISVAQLCDAEGLALSRRFVEWLMANYEVSIEDDEGDDVTGVPLDTLYAV